MEIASVHPEGALLLAGGGPPDPELDQLGGALAQLEVAPFLGPALDGRVQRAAGGGGGGHGEHPAEGQDDDLGGAGAEVHHGHRRRPAHREVGADGGGHGLADEGHLAAAGGPGGILHRPPLHLAGVLGYAHHHARAHDGPVGERAHDAVPNQHLGELVVGDAARLDRVGGDDVLGGAPQHLLGRLAHREDPARALALLDGDDGGGLHQQAPGAVGHPDVGGAQVDGQVLGEPAERGAEHGGQSPKVRMFLTCSKSAPMTAATCSAWATSGLSLDCLIV